MILLSGANDILRVVTTTVAPVDVYVSFASLNVGTPTPNNQTTTITAAGTNTVLAAPGAGLQATARSIIISNRDAALANVVTVEAFNGATARRLFKATLAAGEFLIYEEGIGWKRYSIAGLEMISQTLGSSQAVLNQFNLVVLSADVTNSNGVANTLQDVTGMSFPVVAGGTYWYKFSIEYTSAATTTGSRWVLNGPAFSRLTTKSIYTLTAAADTLNTVTAYQQPATANASSLTAGNLAIIEGFVSATADGNIQLQFASEILSSAIVAKAGSQCVWTRTI